MGEEIVKVFEHQFKESTFNEDLSMLDFIPKIITEEQGKKID